MDNKSNASNKSNQGELRDENIKILIVEDEPDARMIFKSLLELHTQYTILEASDGVEALKLLESDHTIDLVLLDIIMPQIDGVEVLKTVKEESPKYGNPKIIMLTNLSSSDSEERSKAYKADGYIIKVNIEPVDLVKEIERHLVSEVIE